MPASPRLRGRPDRPRHSARALAWLALAALSGCAQLPSRAPETAPGAGPAPAAQAPAAPRPPPPAPAPPAPEPRPGTQPPPAGLPEPWTALRDGLRFADCADPDATTTAARARLLRDRAALRRQFTEVAPRLALVLDAVVAAGLPTEFALLPLVESGYRALPARGNRPAGPWQFMPATARANGLRIDATRDARLDFTESTAAALRLLARLGAEFEGDWSLATMAFNTGEFRVRRALAAQPGSAPGALRLGDITRGHLARLRALACIVHDPAGAGIELPELHAARRLVAVPLDRALPLAEVAHWSGVASDRLRALNAARRDARVGAGENLLLPVGALPGFAMGHARWVAADGGDGGEHVVLAGDSLWTIARRFGTSVRELARRNRIDPARPLRPGQVLRLP